MQHCLHALCLCPYPGTSHHHVQCGGRDGGGWGGGETERERGREEETAERREQTWKGKVSST